MEGHDQRLPWWALRSLHPVIRNGLKRDLAEWRRTLQSDPCSYCGEAGGQADHIVARGRGGGKGWLNLTGACRSCNRAKGQRGLLAFITGTQSTVDTGKMPGARFGKLQRRPGEPGRRTKELDIRRMRDQNSACRGSAGAAGRAGSTGLPATTQGSGTTTGMDPRADDAGWRMRRRGRMQSAGRRRKRDARRSRKRRSAVRARSDSGGMNPRGCTQWRVRVAPPGRREDEPWLVRAPASERPRRPAHKGMYPRIPKSPRTGRTSTPRARG